MADSTAKARYRVVTNGVDIDGLATDFESESDIDKAEVVGHVNSPDLDNTPNPDIGSANVVEIEVTASAATAEDASDAIVAAATAVGDVAIVTHAEGGAFQTTADGPTLVADDDAPTQVEEAATETVILTAEEFVTASGIDVTLEVVDADGAGDFFTVTDNEDGTYDVDFDAPDGSAGEYVIVFQATDTLGQSVTETVTLTVTTE